MLVDNTKGKGTPGVLGEGYEAPLPPPRFSSASVIYTTLNIDRRSRSGRQTNRLVLRLFQTGFPEVPDQVPARSKLGE